MDRSTIPYGYAPASDSSASNSQEGYLASASASTTPSTPAQSSGKRPGRPPGSKNKPKGPQSGSGGVPRGTPTRRGRPRGSKNGVRKFLAGDTNASSVTNPSTIDPSLLDPSLTSPSTTNPFLEQLPSADPLMSDIRQGKQPEPRTESEADNSPEDSSSQPKKGGRGKKLTPLPPLYPEAHRLGCPCPECPPDIVTSLYQAEFHELSIGVREMIWERYPEMVSVYGLEEFQGEEMDWTQRLPLDQGGGWRPVGGEQMDWSQAIQEDQVDGFQPLDDAEIDELQPFEEEQRDAEYYQDNDWGLDDDMVDECYSEEFGGSSECANEK